MTLNKQCSCKTHLTTKNTYSIGRNDVGLWLNCKKCNSTALFLEKEKQEVVYNATKAIFGNAFDLSEMNYINGGK